MESEYRLNTKFYRELRDSGYSVGDILQDIGDGQDPMKVLCSWTDLSNDEIRGAIFQKERDQEVPAVQEAI